MGEMNLGEIRMFAGATAPAGWRLCDGSSLQKSGNKKLSDLLANRYGGDATTFRLPDLRGRLPVNAKTPDADALGQTGGTEDVILTADNLPLHAHHLSVSTAHCTSGTPGNTVYLGADSVKFYAPSSAGSNVFMDAGAISPYAGQLPIHLNLMPSLSVNFIICVEEPVTVYEQFLGEIRAFVFGGAPAGWIACDGAEYRADYPQLVPVLGMTYGWPVGQEYELPDLRGRAGMGNGFGPEYQTYLGYYEGLATTPLSANNVPAHSHSLTAKSPASDQTQAASTDAMSMIAKHPASGGSGPSADYAFAEGTADVALAPDSISAVGMTQPHENRQPFIAFNFYICTSGIAP